MQVTKVLINYQANYNGCDVVVNEEFDARDLRKTNPELSKKLEALQDDVTNKAYDDVITEGRYEGLFNGDEDDLKKYAFNKAREMFGADIALEFNFDEEST